MNSNKLSNNHKLLDAEDDDEDEAETRTNANVKFDLDLSDSTSDESNDMNSATVIIPKLFQNQAAFDRFSTIIQSAQPSASSSSISISEINQYQNEPQTNLPCPSSDLRLNPNNFHSFETFGRFIRNSLNLDDEVIKEMFSNPKIKFWLDRNKSQGFVYQNYPRIDESKRQIPPVRCELCKFYGHLSHNCSIKELAFKLYNVELKSGACRCHICGQLGHPAEPGLCPYLACSFCQQLGHWNHMCPEIERVSRTLCYRCQRYGHKIERCPDQWRQFDRISTFEQTPFKDPIAANKPVYCYQCAKKGHYGHNCPEYYRKYFIRDNHQLNPVYFFSGSSPYAQNQAKFTENDINLINHLIERPMDDSYFNGKVNDENISNYEDDDDFEEDPLVELEKYQAEKSGSKVWNINDPIQVIGPKNTVINLKTYIRKWVNWVIDFHWIFTLKYLSESIPIHKLYYFIKKYPLLDNFILNWMWWSYSLNKELELFTKDPFKSVGSMPWLIYDVRIKRLIEANVKESLNLSDKFNHRILFKQVPRQPSKFFQYNEFTMKTIGSMLFNNEFSNQSSISIENEKLNNTQNKHLKKQNKKKANKKTSNTNNINKLNRSVDELDDNKDDVLTAGLLQLNDEIQMLKFKDSSDYLDVQINNQCSVTKTEEVDQLVNPLSSLITKSSSDENYLSTNNTILNENESLSMFLKDDELENTIIYNSDLNKDNVPVQEAQRETTLDNQLFFKESHLKPENCFQLPAILEPKNISTDISMMGSSGVISKVSFSPDTAPQPESVFDRLIRSVSGGNLIKSDLQVDEMNKQNKDNLSKLIDSLKKSSNVNLPENEHIIITVPPNTLVQCSPEDNKNQIDIAGILTEAEIINDPSVNLNSNSPSRSNQSSESSDIIKLLLKIDNSKSKTPPRDIIGSNLLATTQSSDSKSSSNTNNHLLNILKGFKNDSNRVKSIAQEPIDGFNILDKILLAPVIAQTTIEPASTSTQPINIDTASISSSSSLFSSSSCGVFSSSSLSSGSSCSNTSISPAGTSVSQSSSNSSTAKPNVDSSLSTSISSLRSNQTISSSSLSSSLSSPPKSTVPDDKNKCSTKTDNSSKKSNSASKQKKHSNHKNNNNNISKVIGSRKSNNYNHNRKQDTYYYNNQNNKSGNFKPIGSTSSSNSVRKNISVNNNTVTSKDSNKTNYDKPLIITNNTFRSNSNNNLNNFKKDGLIGSNGTDLFKSNNNSSIGMMNNLANNRPLIEMNKVVENSLNKQPLIANNVFSNNSMSYHNYPNNRPSVINNSNNKTNEFNYNKRSSNYNQNKNQTNISSTSHDFRTNNSKSNIMVKNCPDQSKLNSKNSNMLYVASNNSMFNVNNNPNEQPLISNNPFSGMNSNYTQNNLNMGYGNQKPGGFMNNNYDISKANSANSSLTYNNSNFSSKYLINNNNNNSGNKQPFLINNSFNNTSNNYSNSNNNGNRSPLIGKNKESYNQKVNMNQAKTNNSNNKQQQQHQQQQQFINQQQQPQQHPNQNQINQQLLSNFNSSNSSSLQPSNNSSRNFFFRGHRKSK